MVMHPTFPVFDTALGHLTPAMEMACARIFTVLDRDGDGRLSAAEMQLQQYLTHRIRVTEGEMLNTLKVRATAVRRASTALTRPDRPCIAAGDEGRRPRSGRGHRGHR